MFLIDTNVLIYSSRVFSINDNHPFWTLLEENLIAEQVGTPLAIYNEVIQKDDPLKEWIARLEITQSIILRDGPYSLNEVILNCYGGDLSSVQLSKIVGDAN